MICDRIGTQKEGERRASNGRPALMRSEKLKKKHILILAGLSAVLILLVVFGALSLQHFSDKQKEIGQKQESLTQLQNEQELLQAENQILDEMEQQAKEQREREEEEARRKEEEEQAKATEGTEGSEKIAYLTFDDGVSVNTPELLDILRKYDVKATFFPNWHPELKEYYNLILAQGHVLGNHTATHDYRTIYASLDNFKKDVTWLSDNIQEQTGVRPTLFRFPGGTSNTVNFTYNDHDASLIPAAVDWITAEGYVYFDWNVDSGDASGRNYSAEQLTQRVLAQAENKDRIVILMHDNGVNHASIEAVPAIIEGLREQGFTFRVLTNDTEPVRFRPAE